MLPRRTLTPCSQVNAMADVRSDVLRYIRSQLMGPVHGSTEVLRDPPDQRYAVGVLYPVESRQEEAIRDDIQDDAGGSGLTDVTDDPIALASQWLPSSVGFTFYQTGDPQLQCDVWGATYEQLSEGKKGEWQRVSLKERGSPETISISWRNGAEARERVAVLSGRAELDVHARSLGKGHLITVTLLNSRTHNGDGRPSPDDCLYQVGLECRPARGQIAEYPRVEHSTADPEEEELILTFRQAKVHAIGHGCAAVWETAGERPASIRSEFIPAREVPGLSADVAKIDALRLSLLADPASDRSTIVAGLRGMVNAYSDWIESSVAAAPPPGALLAAQARIVSRLKAARERMLTGLALLEADDEAWKAFQLANMAMLTQMHHSRVIASERRARHDPIPTGIDYLSLDDYRWYPFQMAFFLVTARSTADADAADRNIVDLLWFPTGGGKTEAYLLLAAYAVFLRRLRSGDRGAGTTVITRYTLRLLTTQQFQRAAALVCACELIRRSDDSLGAVPISIGLWVGGDASPNTYQDARQLLDRLHEGEPGDEALPIDRCPWCGTGFLPKSRSDDPDDLGIEADNSSFRMRCVNASCEFSDRLPISFVDDDLYANPPTLLLGTVDKFARLAWRPGGGAFFGLDRHDPPSLIIQDELHLISGPLGSTVGVYEAAIEALLELAGAAPKIVASTATIRRAPDQAAGLFGREVSVFPPPGVDAGDSYFARTDDSAPGRLYVGIMSQNHTPSSAVVHTAAVLAQAVSELELEGPSRDAYWTQVIYHNSLRELGKTVTFARDDIPARIEVIQPDPARRRELKDDDVVELTSNVHSTQIPAILARMATPAVSADAIGLLLATNMIQVGIDVPRLGLMLVNGQPKTTSEYIQASSRIGRGITPGIVVTLYSPSKPRDRSHYESFLSYHLALYRYVEPSSVTPFALQSRARSLHAALVIAVRHGAGLAENHQAVEFDRSNPRVSKALDVLLRRAAASDPLEDAQTRAHIERLADEWEKRAHDAKRDASSFHYEAAGKAHRRLLRRFGERGEGWETLDSMRSVDLEVPISIIGATDAN
jgi:hypothetical protein